MTPSLTTTTWTPAWPRSASALLLLLAGIGLLYADTFQGMVAIWDRSDTFAHAYVVPPLALWLAWRQRGALALQAPQPGVAWLLPFGLLALVWLLGQLVAANAVTQLCATAMLVLSVPLVLGRRVAMVILFPLAFLFFAVPIGEFMIPPLMQLTAEFTVLALRLSGIPVYREGLQFVIPSGNWSVVEACSGVRYLMASFMVGSLFAYLNYSSWRRRLIFGVVSLVVPIVANWLRAYMIVMLGHLSGNKIATGADHLVYGWVFFGVVITVLFMIGARWSEAPADPKPPTASASVGSAAGPLPHWMVAVAGLVLAALPVLAVSRIDAAESRVAPHLAALPAQAGGWRLDASAGEPWKPIFKNPSAESVTRYVAPNGQAVGVYLAYYRHQGEGRKLVSSENVLVSSERRQWNPVETSIRTVAAETRSIAVRQTRLLHAETSRSTTRDVMVVWQLYWVNGSLTHQDHWAKVAGAWHRLQGRGDESAAIVLNAVDAPGAPASAVLESFVRANLSMIEAGLQATRDAR